MSDNTSDIVERLRSLDETIRFHVGHDLGMTEGQWLVVAQDLKLAAAEIERLRQTLERIQALRDGYTGGNDDYAQGRKAGYRVCGDIAETALTVSKESGDAAALSEGDDHAGQ